MEAAGGGLQASLLDGLERTSRTLGTSGAFQRAPQGDMEPSEASTKPPRLGRRGDTALGRGTWPSG